MSTPYTGNAAAVQSPSAAPGPGIIPVVSTLQDGIDNINAAAFAQQQKLCADFFAHYAFPGRVGHFRERWDIAPATLTSASTGVIADLAKRWNFSISAGTTQTAAFQNPATASGNYASRTVKLDQGTGNAAQLSGLWTAFPIWAAPSVGYRFLFEVDVQPTTSTLNSREWHIGLEAALGVTGGVEFYSDYTLANWQASTGGVLTDTGIAVNVGTTWTRLAFLIDTTIGTPAVIYFINGAQVATRTASLPAAGANNWIGLSGRQVSTGACAYTVGDLVCTWTKF